jgi:hypothetical protein
MGIQPTSVGDFSSNQKKGDVTNKDAGKIGIQWFFLSWGCLVGVKPQQ